MICLEISKEKEWNQNNFVVNFGLVFHASDVENLSDDFLGNQLGEKSEIAKNLEKNRCEICDIECTNQFHQAIIVKS